MRSRYSMRGMTLVEIMVATTVAGIITATAMTFFIRTVRYGRITYEQTELSDKSRLARDALTQDLLATGYAWEHEGAWDTDSSATVGDIVPTGYFGVAGKGAALNVAWPLYPISGVNNNAAADVLQLIVPTGTVLGLNASMSHPHYHCYQVDNAGGNHMTFTISNPTAGTAGWLQNRIVVISGNGMTLLTTLFANASTGVGGVVLNDMAPAGSQTCTDVACGACEAGGAPSDPTAMLPPNTKGYPAALVRYEVVNVGGVPALTRCTFNTAGAPGTCTGVNTIVNGIEDFQVRYVFMMISEDATSGSEVVVNGSSTATGSLDLLDDDYLEISANHPKRKVAGPNLDEESMRLLAVEVGLVVRAARPNPGYTDRGRRPPMFDRPGAGAADSFRRMPVTFRVPVPGATAYGQ